jgi:hypothetical protein
MDHPDPTVRKLLDAMALMENRLTEALAARGGEQTPTSSFASLFDSFEGTTTSSTTTLQYVDDVFSSSVGAAYAASPCARPRSPSYDDDKPVFDAWPLFDEEPVDRATTQALFSDDVDHCFGDELDTDRTMEFRFPTSEFDIKQVVAVVSNTKDSLEFASARRVEIRTRVTVACEDWVVDHNVDAATVAGMAHLTHDYFTLPPEDKPPLGPYIDTAPSPASFIPQLVETEEEDEVFHTSPSTCSTMVPNRDATTSMLAMVEATWSDEYALVDLQSICNYSTSKAKPKLNSLDEVDPELLKTFIPLTEQKCLSNVAIDAVLDSTSIAITHHLNLCTVTSVSLGMDDETNEVFAKISLSTDPHHGPTADSRPDHTSNSLPQESSNFTKELMQSNTNNNGGFSVPCYCANDIVTELTDVTRVGSMVTKARQLVSTSTDAQVMFDEMQQRRYVWDNFVLRIPFADGKNYEPHKSWKDNLDATGKAQQLIYITGWLVDTEITFVRDAKSKPGGDVTLGELFKRSMLTEAKFIVGPDIILQRRELGDGCGRGHIRTYRNAGSDGCTEVNTCSSPLYGCCYNEELVRDSCSAVYGRYQITEDRTEGLDDCVTEAFWFQPNTFVSADDQLVNFTNGRDD